MGEREGADRLALHLPVRQQPDPGCYGCLGTGLMVWGKSPANGMPCSCITGDPDDL